MFIIMTSTSTKESRDDLQPQVIAEMPTHNGQRDCNQNWVSDDVQASKGNLEKWKSLWKDKNESSSGKPTSQRQIQNPVLFTDNMAGPQDTHPHTERILIVPEP